VGHVPEPDAVRSRGGGPCPCSAGRTRPGTPTAP
jgi:hypothetical protein